MWGGERRRRKKRGKRGEGERRGGEEKERGRERKEKRGEGKGERKKRERRRKREERLQDVVDRKALERSVLRPPAPVRQVAQAAGPRDARFAVRDDRRHRWMIVREPVGRTVAVADLLLGELQLRALRLSQWCWRRIGIGGRRRSGCRNARRCGLRRNDTRRQWRQGVRPRRWHLT